MKRFLILFAAVLGLSNTPAVSAVITMDDGRYYSAGYDNGGMGSGRGVGLLANQNFNMTAMAIDLSVVSAFNGLAFEIFSSADGHSAGSLLASSIFNLNAGSGYQDQAFNFSFLSGNYYVLNFRRLDNASLGSNFGTKYSWEDPGSFVPFDYGVFTAYEGFEGAAPLAGNPLIPHLRLTGDVGGAVPEPATVLMLGLGLLGLAASRKRRS